MILSPMNSYLTLGILLIMLFRQSYSVNQIGHETCDGETFAGRCEMNQVMVMLYARYGRMRLGRCVTNDLGHLGCESNVLSLFDEWCSGLPSCDVFISNVNEELYSRRTCIADLRSHMQIEFTCINVVSPDKAICQAHNGAELQASKATLSSHVTDDTGCGSLGVPWVIRTSPGQRVSVSLTDFGWHREEMTAANTRCRPYGYIGEPDLGINQTLCGGMSRESEVYESSSNHVVIQMLTSSQREIKASFLINYAVTGCPDITPPLHAWYTRNGNTAVVGCEWSEHTWHLKCEANTWVGVVGNCSGGGVATASVPKTQWSMSPLLSVSLIIGLGVLVVALFCIALIGCICILRSRGGNERQGEPPAGFPLTDQQQAFLYYPGRPIPVEQPNSTHIRGTMDRGTCDSSNVQKPTATDELIHIWETPLPIPKQTLGSAGVSDSAATMSGRGTLPGPPQVYKDGSTISRSDYSTDTYWAGTDRYFDNDLGWITMPPKQ